MRVYKRGDKWWSSWTADSTTVRRSTGCTTREAAMLVAQRWERERADPAHAAKETARFTVESDLFIDDVKARKGVPDGTVNMYECKAGHLNRLMPERMADVDVAAVDAYFKARRDEGASGSTLHKEWVTLRGVLRSAARRGRWSGELDILKPSWISPASQERTRRLTWPELRALLDQAPPALADLVRYAVATGARRSELMRAQEGDVHPATNMAIIRGSKTEASRKAIPVPPMFRALLPARAWGAKPTGARLFPACPADLRCLNASCTAAKIKPVSYNDLRRTFASLMLDAGVTNTVAAKLLRHTSTAMVDRVYGRVDDGALAALVERQAAVPPVDQRLAKQDVCTDGTDCKQRGFVGQDRLELSANGLRGLFDTLKLSEKERNMPARVPPVDQRLPYAKPTLMRLVLVSPAGAKRHGGAS